MRENLSFFTEFMEDEELKNTESKSSDKFTAKKERIRGKLFKIHGKTQ